VAVVGRCRGHGLTAPLPVLVRNSQDLWIGVSRDLLITSWMTEYLGLAVEERRASGITIDDPILAHLSPAHSEPVHFFGSIPIDVDKELAQLDATGYRPLRRHEP
jgi:hypothetical protein